MKNITVNTNKTVGKIKPMHAVGQPPFRPGFNTLDFSPMQILKDANIPYSRLHDVGGVFGGNRYIDIPNIFRDFSADENNPESYDFAFTDELLRGMAEYGIKPYYRLGVTIENQSNVKAYRIYPPEDFEKWARICEHIIRHYNEGWAKGFYYDIQYWEIWNEPENREDPNTNQMWRGTKEEYYRLYDVTAKHLKKCFGNKIKVGGYGACGFYGIFGNPKKYGLNINRLEGERYNCTKGDYRIEFLFGFFDYIKNNNSPIDFFSWHTYGRVDITFAEAEFLGIVLKKYGYEHIETHLNEWNLSHDRKINKGTSFASSQVAAMMCAMQTTSTSMLMYYDAQYVSVSPYAGFYDVVTFEPSCVYYVFKAFGELYALKNRVECEVFGENLYSLAAGDTENTALLITNTGKGDIIKTNLPPNYKIYLIDENNLMVETNYSPKEFLLGENQTVLIKG